MGRRKKRVAYDQRTTPAIGDGVQHTAESVRHWKDRLATLRTGTITGGTLPPYVRHLNLEPPRE